MLSYREYVSRQNRRCSIIAHRGAWRDGAPENSVASIERAAALGYEIVEIDVRMSADGVLIVHHDATLERTTGRPETPESLPADALVQLKLKEGAGGPQARETAQTLPTLKTMLVAARKHRRYLDLDVKQESLMESVAQAAADAGAAAFVNIKFPINDEATLDRALRIERETGVAVVATAHFTSSRDDALMERLAKLRPMMIQATADQFGDIARVAPELSSHGSALWTYILDVSPWPNGLDEQAALADPEGVWGAAIRSGISAIMTDHPQELDKLIRQFEG